MLASPSPLSLRFALLLASLASLLLLFLASPCVLLVPVSASLPSQTPILAFSNGVYQPVVAQARQAYGLTQKSFTSRRMQIDVGGVDQGIKALQSGNYDFIVMTSVVPAAHQVLHPKVNAYPIMINAACPFYNLPADVGGDMLRMDMVHMCQILRGNITQWNDPRLQLRNPTLTLPNKNITLVTLGFGSDSLLTVSTLCSKVDPVWATAPGLGSTSLPTYSLYIPQSRRISVTPVQAVAGLASVLVDTPYSFAVAPQAAASLANVRYVALINKAGATVLPNKDTLAQAFLELSAKGIQASTSNFDLTNPSSTSAWPLTMCGWVWIHSTSVVSTCASKRTALQFLLWMYTSPVVARAAEEAVTPIVPELFIKRFGLIEAIEQDIMCGSTPMISSGAMAAASVQGSGLAKSTMSFMVQMYEGVDPSLKYTFSTLLDDSLSLQRVAGNELDVGLVATAGMRDDQLQLFTSDIELVGGVPRASLEVQLDELGNIVPPQGEVTMQHGGMIIPTFLSAVVVNFALPSLVSSQATGWTATRVYAGGRTLPQLYPLRATVDFLTRAFIGLVTSWLDPELVHWNPQLVAWFNVTGAPTTLKTLVCCSDATDPLVATTVLTRTLMRSHLFSTAFGNLTKGYSYETSRVIFWDVPAVPASRQMMVDREPRMAGKLAMEPGTISYKMLAAATSSPNTDFQIIVPGGDTYSRFPAPHPDDDTVAASTASISACVSGVISDPVQLAAMLDPVTGRYWSGQTQDGEGHKKRAKGCYPLTALTSFALPRSSTNGRQGLTSAASNAQDLTAGSCARARKNLEFAAWVQTAPLLADVAVSSGLIRLADFTPLRIHAMSMLNSATCDGKTILITLPIIWSMPSAAHVVAIVAATVMLLLVAVSTWALYQYRNISVIRGSSPLFLAVGLGGLVMCTISLVIWTGEVTSARCTSFMWMVNMGFTLVFAPLFAKTWRIYQIFSGKKIKIVKISNHKLGAVVAAVFGLDVVLLAIWSGVSPLQPVLFIRDPTSIDGAFEHTTMCAPDGDAGFTMLAVEAVFKGALLFFGALMGFSTRKVASAYNESSGIAWSIYNTVLAGVVVAGLIVTLDTIGDTLIWLVLFLLLWVMFCTWAFIFVPKGQGILAVIHDGKTDAVTELPSTGNNSALASQFSFVAVVGMSKDKLLMYAKALEMQLSQVRRRLQALHPSSGQLQGASFNKEQPQPPSGSGTVSVTTQRTLGYIPLSPYASASIAPMVVSPAPNPHTETKSLANSNGIVTLSSIGGGSSCGDASPPLPLLSPSRSTSNGAAVSGTTALAPRVSAARSDTLPGQVVSKSQPGGSVGPRRTSAAPFVSSTAIGTVASQSIVRLTSAGQEAEPDAHADADRQQQNIAVHISRWGGSGAGERAHPPRHTSPALASSVGGMSGANSVLNLGAAATLPNSSAESSQGNSSREVSARGSPSASAAPSAASGEVEGAAPIRVTVTQSK